jgi:hypothetical protein
MGSTSSSTIHGRITMQSRIDRTGGEIDWPDWADRTRPAARERTSKFSVTLATSISDIETELEDRLGVDDWRLSTAAPHRQKDGRPYANASPDNPGAVVRWSMDGEQFAVACDRYTQLRDNVREVGLYIEEKRKMGTRPVRTGQDEFATARLPSADDDDLVVAGGETEAPHEVIGVSVDAPDAVVEAAYRELLKERHPDHGGTAAELRQLNQAREAMLDG